MLVAIARQLAITVVVLGMVGISAILWPLEDLRPERQLAAAGAKLCFAHDETMLVGALLEGQHIGDDLVIVASKVPSLQRLSLIDSRVSDHGIRSLQSLQKLSSLNLSRASLTGESLIAMAECPALRELRLDGSEWLRDDHLVELARLKNLEILSLADTNVTTTGLEHLRYLPKLRYLLLDRCHNITDESVDDLISLCQENHLNLSLSGTEITLPQLVRMRRTLTKCAIQFRPETMTGLRAIGERGQFMTNELGEIRGFRRRADLDGLFVPLRPGDLTVVATTASELVEINLDHSNVDDVMFQELRELPRLEVLRLSSCFATDDSLSVLSRFPNLLSLSLMENDIDGRGLVHLQHVPQLTSLRVQSRRGDDILDHLQSLTHLRTLVICAPLSNEGMERISKLPRLSSLTLIGTDVRRQGIAKLADSQTLNELRFEGGLIDDSDIDACAELPLLKWLILPQNSLTRAGRDRLSKLRPDLAVEWTESLMRR
ncbi:MAG: RNI-like protein [Schlesneria sp.]|nr:RNI-like protein [Schlesneria sp.]